MRNFLKLGQQVGFLPVSGNDDELLEKMSALQELFRETFPVVLTVHGSNTRVILPLDTDKCRVRIDKFTGTASVFGRAITGTAGDEKVDLLPIPGLAQVQHMNRQQRRGAARQGQTEQANEMVVRGPEITLRVLAVEQ